MGRRPDTPQMQDSKGNPGKRMSKAARALAEAERLAALMAAAPAESNNPLAPPAILEIPALLPALEVWRRYVPRLRDMNIIKPEIHRDMFALFCIHLADYYKAVQEVAEKGSEYRTKTGFIRPRRAALLKEHLPPVLMDMSKKWGLTAIDFYSLIREQAAHGSAPVTAPVRDINGSASTHGDDNDLVGMAARSDSIPPATLQ